MSKNVGENSSYLFPELEHPDFEAALAEELMATHDEDQEAVDKHTTASTPNAGHSYERMRVIKVHEGTSHQAEGGRLRPFGHDDGNPPLDKEGPPGAPPRPGLRWKEETHRWIRPEQLSGLDIPHEAPEHEGKDHLRKIMSPDEHKIITEMIDHWTSEEGPGKKALSYTVTTMIDMGPGSTTGWGAASKTYDHETAQAAVAKQYEYTQEVLRHRYPEGEILLYRGFNVSGGTRQFIRANAVASWTDKEELAHAFGNRVLVEKVPIEEILAYPGSNGDLADYSPDEFMRIGSGEGKEYSAEVGNMVVSR